MERVLDMATAIDWVSMKLTGISVVFALITGGSLMTVLALIATGSTIVYNIIRIYKEVKNKNK